MINQLHAWHRRRVEGSPNLLEPPLHHFVAKRRENLVELGHVVGEVSLRPHASYPSLCSQSPPHGRTIRSGGESQTSGVPLIAAAILLSEVTFRLCAAVLSLHGVIQ